MHKRIKTRELVMLACMTGLTVCTNLICTYTVPLYAGTAFVIITGVALGPFAGAVVGVTARFICNMYLGQGVWTIWQMLSWAIIGAAAGAVFCRIDVGIYANDGIKKKKKLTESGLLLLLVFEVIGLLAAYILYILFTDKNEGFLGWRVYIIGALCFILWMVFSKKKLSVDDFTLAGFTFVVTFFIYGGVINAGTMVMAAAMPASETEFGIKSLKILYITGLPFDIMHAFGASVTNFLIGKKVIRRIERVKIKYGFYRSK